MSVVDNFRSFVIPGSCSVKQCLLSGKEVEPRGNGILIALYMLLRATTMIFCVQARCSMVVPG